MATSTISTAPAQPARALIEQVARDLVDRLYGPDGLPWGTRMSELEDTVLAVGKVLSDTMLDEALKRQSSTVANRPEPFQCCSKCGQEVDLKSEPEPRIVMTRAGEAQWLEPKTYCRTCRRSFFPSEPEFGDRSR